MQRYLDHQIQWTKEDKLRTRAWGRKLPCEPQEYIEHLREIYHEIPKAIERCNIDRRRINECGFVGLDSRIGKALDRRDVATLVGAERMCVDFDCRIQYESGSSYTGYFRVEYIYGWYGPTWLKELAGTGNRSRFYKRFEQLKAQGQDAIDSEVGLMILGGV